MLMPLLNGIDAIILDPQYLVYAHKKPQMNGPSCTADSKLNTCTVLANCHFAVDHRFISISFGIVDKPIGGCVCV